MCRCTGTGIEVKGTYLVGDYVSKYRPSSHLLVLPRQRIVRWGMVVLSRGYTRPVQSGVLKWYSLIYYGSRGFYGFRTLT